MKRKVYRNLLFKGVISIEKALELLSHKGWTENKVIVKYRGKDFIISRNDINNICIEIFVR